MLRHSSSSSVLALDDTIKCEQHLYVEPIQFLWLNTSPLAITTNFRTAATPGNLITTVRQLGNRFIHLSIALNHAPPLNVGTLVGQILRARLSQDFQIW